MVSKDLQLTSKNNPVLQKAGKGIKPHDWDHKKIRVQFRFFRAWRRWNAGGQKLAGKELFCKMTSHTEQVENMRFDELIWNFII